MPYIDKDRREEMVSGGIVYEYPKNSGELNFVITLIIKDYLHGKGLSYQTINDIVGALEGAKAEFQRRVVAPYEDSKIKENGDVY